MTDHVHLESRLKLVEDQVRHQAETVDLLHQDSIRTQSAIASIAAHIDSLVDTLHGIETKLDEHRTRRPELAGLAAVAAVILTIVGGLGFVVFDRIDIIDEHVARQDAVVDQIISSRFTKEDAYRLENRLQAQCAK